MGKQILAVFLPPPPLFICYSHLEATTLPLFYWSQGPGALLSDLDRLPVRRIIKRFSCRHPKKRAIIRIVQLSGVLLSGDYCSDILLFVVGVLRVKWKDQDLEINQEQA